jgi:hypothetical protein
MNGFVIYSDIVIVIEYSQLRGDVEDIPGFLDLFEFGNSRVHTCQRPLVV